MKKNDLKLERFLESKEVTIKTKVRKQKSFLINQTSGCKKKKKIDSSQSNTNNNLWEDFKTLLGRISYQQI